MSVSDHLRVPGFLQPLVKHYRFLRTVRRGVPVIVYQMGKVGSSSVVRSLKEAGVAPVYHIHRMNPEYIAHVWSQHGDQRDFKLDRIGLKLYKHVIQKGRPARFITLVREPVGRNISDFFQHLDLFMNINPAEIARYSVETLIAGYLNRPPNPVPLIWFDREMRPVLDLDVYAHPFPKEKGYLQLKNGPFDVLLLKL